MTDLPPIRVVNPQAEIREEAIVATLQLIINHLRTGRAEEQGKEDHNDVSS